MSLHDWQRNGWLVSHETSAEEIRNLLAQSSTQDEDEVLDQSLPEVSISKSQYEKTIFVGKK